MNLSQLEQDKPPTKFDTCFSPNCHQQKQLIMNQTQTLYTNPETLVNNSTQVPRKPFSKNSNPFDKTAKENRNRSYDSKKTKTTLFYSKNPKTDIRNFFPEKDKELSEKRNLQKKLKTLVNAQDYNIFQKKIKKLSSVSDISKTHSRTRKCNSSAIAKNEHKSCLKTQ